MSHSILKASDIKNGCLEILDEDGKPLMILELSDSGYFNLDLYRASKHIGFDLKEKDGKEVISGEARRYEAPRNPDEDASGVIESLYASDSVSWKSRSDVR